MNISKFVSIVSGRNMCKPSECHFRFTLLCSSMNTRLVWYWFYLVWEIYSYVLCQMTDRWCSEFPSLKKWFYELRPSFLSQDKKIGGGKCSAVDLCSSSWSNNCHSVGFNNLNTSQNSFSSSFGADLWLKYCSRLKLKIFNFHSNIVHAEACPATPCSCDNKSCWVMGFPAWLNPAGHIPAGQTYD